MAMFVNEQSVHEKPVNKRPVDEPSDERGGVNPPPVVSP